MMTHEQKTRLGIFLSLATVVFIAVAGFFILPKLRDTGEIYTVNFRNTSVQGLIIGSLVKYRGVEVGRVVRVRVNPTDLDSVLIDVKIREGVVVKKDMTALMAYVGLTGQKYIEISGGTLAAENLKAHGEIPTGRGLNEKADDIIKNIDTTASGSPSSWPPRTSNGSRPSSTTPRGARPPSPASSRGAGRPSRTRWPTWKKRPPSSPGRPRDSCP